MLKCCHQYLVAGSRESRTTEERKVQKQRERESTIGTSEHTIEDNNQPNEEGMFRSVRG